MRSPRPGSVSRALRAAVRALALVLVATFAWAGAAGAESSSRDATISGSFSDGCRDFTSHATKVGSEQGKDISNVEIQYADGRSVKDETVGSPDYSLDGVAGDEIDFAIVKSGTTSEWFDCAQQNSPPTALLELETPHTCSPWPDGLVDCDGRIARTSWTRSFVPAVGFGHIRFFCSWPDDQSCIDHVMPCGQLDGYSVCQVTYTFRGTSSTDPDNDIVSWSIDFGDGTSASGDWSTNPPNEVSHTYQIHHCPTCSREPAMLTVTDSAGNADADAQFVEHVYPD